MNKKKAIIIAGAAAIALVAVLLVIVFWPKNSGKEKKRTATIDEGIDMSVSVDENGIHQAKINTDGDGNISNNSYGTLMEYYPANIKQIHVENKKGSFDVDSQTPSGQATDYTIKGYDGIDLQAGVPDKIANAAASLKFTKVATLDKDKGGEYGFDEPRATVTVTYVDHTKAIITVGDDAPQGAGTYIRFGTGDTVYVSNKDTVSAFDFGVTDLVSLTINEAAGSADNNTAGEITLSGSGFDKDITLIPNTDENYTASYLMTAPTKRFANEMESSLVAGGIRGLYASSVKMVNPSESQLGELGLSQPNARVKAAYPDTNVELIASKPDSDGNVNLMVSGGNVVYSISADKVAWAKTSYEKLCSEYVLLPKMKALSGVSVQSGGKTYDFALSTTESTTTDDKGIETTTVKTAVTYHGKEVGEGNFTDFYDLISLIKLSDPKTDGGSGSAALKITYTYSSGSSDTVEFTPASDSYAAAVNGEKAGHAPKSDVTRAVNGLETLLKSI